MKLLPHILFTACALFGATSLAADVIPNGHLQTKDVGWVDSDAAYCHATCDDKSGGALPEHERLNDSEVTGSFVCKAFSHSENGWLYGNNFFRDNADAACLVTTPDGSALEFSTFRCLCVD